MSQVDEAESGLSAEATAPVPGWGWTESALALMVVVWGVNFAVVKGALATFDPLAFNALRFVIASVFVLAVLGARGELGFPAREDVPRIVVLGLVGNVLYQMCFIVGLDLTRAGHASLMLALTPLLTALLSMWKGHESPGPRTWTGAAVTVLGIALVTGSSVTLAESRDVIVGDLILIGAAVVWAVYTVGARPLVQRYGSVRATAWTLWVGAVGLVVVGAPALARQEWAAVSGEAWGGLAFSAFFAIGLAYLIWYRGVERIGNTRTAIFSNLTPVVALAFSALWLGEKPGVLALLGAGLTLGGVMWVRADRGKSNG